jgi:hypothetical protein
LHYTVVEGEKDLRRPDHPFLVQKKMREDHHLQRRS